MTKDDQRTAATSKMAIDESRLDRNSVANDRQ